MPTAEHKPYFRFLITEQTHARLSQIRRDRAHTWDSLLVEMLRRYESKSDDGGHQSLDGTIMQFFGEKMNVLQSQFKGISDQMERHGAVIQTIEPAIEQTNRLLGQVVGLLQLAYGIESNTESRIPDTGVASKLRQFIRRQGKR
jgi:hypothetical protein